MIILILRYHKEKKGINYFKRPELKTPVQQSDLENLTLQQSPAVTAHSVLVILKYSKSYSENSYARIKTYIATVGAAETVSWRNESDG